MTDTTAKATSAGKAERELETLLEAGRKILHKISQINNRLVEMEVRLHGEQPEVNEQVGDPDHAGGILGQFQNVHRESNKVCDRIEEWISRIESAI